MDDLKKEDKPVFGVNVDKDGCAVVTIGVTDAAWEYCKDGKTLTFDLTNIGVGLKLIMFGVRNQQDAKDLIMKHNEKQNLSSLFDKQDFSIKEGAVSKSALKNKL